MNIQSTMLRGMLKAAALLAGAAGLALSLSTAANAVPTLLGTTTNPTGINNLVVDGTTYNVRFSLTTLNTFTFNTTLSNDADLALASALNTFSVTQFDSTPSTEYLIDLDNSLVQFQDAGCLTAAGSCTVGSWTQASDHCFISCVLGDNGTAGFIEAADFTPVPEPLTLSIFAAGLAGAAAMRRRKAKS